MAGEGSAELEEFDPYGRILRILLRELPVVLWTLDESGVFTLQDGKGLEAVGLSPGQFVGKNMLEAYAGHEAEEDIRKVLAGERRHVVAASHGNAWESWYLPVRDEQGAQTGVVGFTMDLTEARKAEAELRAQLALVERQAQVIRALSTPIIEVWDKVLTLPVLGVVDSGRAAEVMDNLLQQVSRKGARFAVLDLTGVDTMDTGTAGHLIKLTQALRLLGAEAIITGIQPAVAQTMITLGVNLTEIRTLASLRDGLRFCMTRMGAEGR